MWQLLVEPEFAEKTIPNLAIEYFDDPMLKRLFIIVLEYYKEFEKVPNLQNQSIQLAINKYKTPNNIVEEESLFSIIKRIEYWNERMLNKEMLHDGDAVRKETNAFIKQQEWRKFAEYIIDKTKNGDIRKKYTMGEIDEKLVKISHIGDDDDYGTEVIENIDRVMRKEFRRTIPTGINVIDSLTGGGLGKGEIGVILTPSGVGKTTMLTKIANTAYEQELNVLQIIFEDTTEQIQRKHFTIWAKSALSKLDDEGENARVKKVAYDKAEKMKGKGRLVVKKLSQENTTMLDVRNWISRYQKKIGFKFDIVILDYLDCLDSHKKTSDRNEAELVIIKSFEAMAADLDIPAWTAIQSNRSGFDAEFVEAHQTGGSIKRIQKAHFFMSVAKTPEQKESGLANVRIIKARFAQDGQTFRDCVFDNDSLEIRFPDETVFRAKAMKNLPKQSEGSLDKIENQSQLLEKASQLKMHESIAKVYDEEKLIEKVNDDAVNEPVNDTESDAETKKIEEYKTAFDKSFNNGGDDVSGDVAPMPDSLKEVVITDVNTNTGKDLLDIDETVGNDEDVIIIENDGATEGAIEGVNEGTTEGIKNEPFEWTGETFTKDTPEPPEVKLEDIKESSEEKTVIVTEKPPTSENNIVKNENREELEKLLVIDPDAPLNGHPSVFDVLVNMGKHQTVVKKE
jgi:replicative DNA helicase